MNELFNSEIIALLALFTSLLATLVLVLVGRKALSNSKEARLSVLEEMIAERKGRLRDKGELEAQVESLSKKRDGLNSITQALQNDLEPLKEKHSKTLLNYEEEKEKLRKLRDEWRGLQDKVELYEARIKQLCTLEEEIAELSKKKEGLLEEIEKLPKVKEELEKLIVERDETTKQLKELKDQIEIHELHKKELKDQIDDLEEMLVEKTEALDILKKEITEKEAELERLDQKVLDVSAEVQVQMDKLKGIGQIPEEAFLSLRTPWLNELKPSVDHADEIQALTKLNTMVEQSGFKLSKRLQYAFHTALKTSDISCLTVMAGVSGTGKSAFPKFYAQAMGIHFLPLAVEPRWDSPQDLFGFLNYMENRYEATTLGRALVQFNNSPFADQHANLNNQVLMVLLDEMNLARIEYYFSEFLSKLEMRRNANLNSEEDYKDVSLEIFAGYPADPEKDLKECPAIRLFAGKNVLFVGTMNEDESTQSLSDKVIDRANVLHFGKPDKLSNIEQNVPNQETSPLSVGAWERWIQKVDNRTVPELDKFERQLNDINNVLADLGRPFGWRTFKAISTYIANYPDPNNHKRAMADQIAMRVMPKLRGTDVNEHAEVFNRLKMQLDQIDDTALTKAFDDAKNSSMGFFNWRGINWEL